MWFGARPTDAWLAVLGSTCLVAWPVLAFYWNDVTLPAFCAAGTPMPLSASFDLAFVFNSPTQLLSGWALMLVAMTPPMIVAPLRHVRVRSFARRRARAISLFVIGYGAVWMIAGVVLQVAALAVQLAVPDAAVRLALALAVVTLWQVTPAKQWCLNRCHSRPQLAAFGAAADRAAVAFGLKHGAACVGACWALMLLPLLVGQGHVLAMFAIMLFVSAERLEMAAPLAWRWRGPGRALRIIVAQTRMWLAPRPVLKDSMP